MTVPGANTAGSDRTRGRTAIGAAADGRSLRSTPVEREAGAQTGHLGLDSPLMAPLAQELLVWAIRTLVAKVHGHKDQSPRDRRSTDEPETDQLSG